MTLQPERRPTEPWPLATLILANLIPLAGVYLWGWNLTDLLLLYWVENAVVGVFTVLTLLAAWPDGLSTAARITTKVFTVPFFIVHYGMFWIGHGIFLMAFFGDSGASFGVGPRNFFLSPIADAWARADMLAWPVAAMVASHGVAFVPNYLAKGEYRTAHISQLMSRPYGRVLVLHFTIVLGGFLAVAIGPSLGVLLLFVAVKIVADVAAHRREQKRARAAPVVGVPATD